MKVLKTTQTDSEKIKELIDKRDKYQAVVNTEIRKLVYKYDTKAS